MTFNNIQILGGMRARMRAKFRVTAVVFLLPIIFASTGRCQTTNIIDQFNPSGTDGYSYSGGQIGDVWMNWFGGAIQSLVWSTNDANTNANSGSLQINANFTTSGNDEQFEVYDGFNGINPPLNGFLYTNFQCDVRFLTGSATGTSGGQSYFGQLQFGVGTTPNFGQDYFSPAVNIPATDTNWYHVSIPISAASDRNLIQINDVLIHIYGPAYYDSPLSGPSTLWVDNIEFVGPTQNNQCTVNWNTTGQRIDGFGASSAWDGSLNQSEAELLFSTNNNMPYTNSVGAVSTNNGAGYSLLRNHIYYATSTSATAAPSTTEGQFMEWAQGYGAKVWSTPWTPAAGFKSTNDFYDTNEATDGGLDGGSYLGIGNNITNVNYASQLANYVANVKSSYGVNLYAISIQNEPDADVTSYEACQWTGGQVHDFVTNLYAALSAKSVSSTKIIIPEDESWQTNIVLTNGMSTNLFINAMSDPAVAPDVGIVACHDYNNVPPNDIPAPLPTLANPNAATWETETANLGSTDDTSITNALYWAGRIYLFMTVADVNAWHYWWLVPGSGNLLDANATPTKRLFAIGQYSRFVRPNFYRMGATNYGDALVSAYKDSASPAFAIVAINSYATNIQQTFTLANFSSASVVTPWITSSNLSLAPQSPVAVTNLSFTYTLPAMSIVTFAGVATNVAPVLAPIPTITVNPGVTAMATNAATDVYAPPQTLTFSLLNAPAGASLNASSGVFSWRPPVSSANTTNVVMVKVANNGTPALAATNSFDVIVNPVERPTFSTPAVSPAVAGEQINLLINGTQGPDYTLLVSTNLTTWQPVLTTNSPALPLALTYTNTGASLALFFRIELGP